MTIDRDPDGEMMRFQCDECGEFLDQDFDQASFQGMLDHAKDKGWKVFKKDHEFTHWCLNCKPSNLEMQKALFNLR